MKLPDLIAASYILHDCEPEPVMLERVRGHAGIRWAIRQIGACFNKRGKWEYEPIPSSRTEAFFKRCRWDTAEDAIAAWVKLGGESRCIGQYGPGMKAGRCGEVR